MRPPTKAGLAALSWATIWTAAALLAAASAPASAQAPARANFGDWQLRCGPTAVGGEQCAITQRVAAEDRGGVWMDAYLFRPPDEEEALILSILVPLQVILTKRLGVRVDGAEIQWFDFRSCSQEGCVVPIALDGTLRAALMAGTEALFIFFFEEDVGVGVPLSLSGFTAGLTALP
jgi:invasion protein IalB